MMNIVNWSVGAKEIHVARLPKDINYFGIFGKMY